MWAVMMVAMMLPSAAPVTLLVAALARKRREAGSAAKLSTAPFVLGYLAVWLAFAAIATLLQWQLDAAELLSETMALASMVVAGGVLVVAGIYHWTPLKQACLRHCRSPLQFLMQHWRDGALGAVAGGARHGVFCFGCCWMLMVLLFVGGITIRPGSPASRPCADREDPAVGRADGAGDWRRAGRVGAPTLAMAA
jgi:predicted metal-binding membrane protein